MKFGGQFHLTLFRQKFYNPGSLLKAKIYTYKASVENGPLVISSAILSRSRMLLPWQSKLSLTHLRPVEPSEQQIIGSQLIHSCHSMYEKLSQVQFWWSFVLPQPLGSVPHVCPHSAVRLSGGSQLHLGDPEAGLQEDPLPGEPVWPVQPQLLSHCTLGSCCPHPASGAGPDWIKWSPCIDGTWAR